MPMVGAAARPAAGPGARPVAVRRTRCRSRPAGDPTTIERLLRTRADTQPKGGHAAAPKTVTASQVVDGPRQS
jgi:hypothetical protein